MSASRAVQLGHHGSRRRALIHDEQVELGLLTSGLKSRSCPRLATAISTLDDYTLRAVCRA